MSHFHQIAYKALQSGYLSVNAAQQLQRLIHIGCGPDDIDAMILLQQALESGKVQRIADSHSSNLSLQSVHGSTHN